MNASLVRPYADGELRAGIENLLDNPELPPEELDEALARVIWSRLAEPADAAAGSLVEALGPGAALSLIFAESSARDICAIALTETGAEIDPRSVAAGLKRWVPRLDRNATLADLSSAAAASMRAITPSSLFWPRQLDDLGVHAPLLLWVRGNPDALVAPSLAVVGARACTGYGTHITAELTEAACQMGAAIVSGAAYGVDAVAHRTAIAASATTVAVVAGGADRPYPAAHSQLLDSITQHGAICSEMVPGSAPTRWRFLMRNRVISALSQATLVTEAGARSGSLNTAGHSAEIGRPIGAVPGPVTSAASAGCHKLIREYGASLITCGDDLRELLGIAEHALFGEGEQDRPHPHHRMVVDALPLRGARSLADITREAGLSAEDARATLTELELLGVVARNETPASAEPLWRLQRRQ